MAAVGRLRGNADVLVAALAVGQGSAQAGALAGLSARTVRRRANDPAFAERVHTARAEVMEATAARLLGLTGQAVDALGDLLASTSSPAVRLRAAQAVLAAAVSLREQLDVEQRLQALEQTASAPQQAILARWGR